CMLGVEAEPARGGWSELEVEARDLDRPRLGPSTPAGARVEPERRRRPGVRGDPTLPGGRRRSVDHAIAEPLEAPVVAGVEELVVGPFGPDRFSRHRDIMDPT